MLFLLAIALTLATLPGTLELLLLTLPTWFGSGNQATARRGSGPSRLAIVIPAHNEEAGLPLTVTSLLACDDPLPASDLVVIADNCSDATAEVARKHGCTVLERADSERRGKGYALDFAFKFLADKGYDGYVIVDADTSVEPNFLSAFRALFARGGDAGQCVYRVGNAAVNVRTRLMNIAFLAFNYLRPLARHRLGLSAGILGNGFALSARTVHEVPYDSFSIVEDLEYHTRLIRAGKRVEFLVETAVWSDMPATSGDAKSQRERWEGGRFRMIVEQVPALLREIVHQRRFGLIEPLFELLLLPLAYHVLMVVGLLLVARGPFAPYAWFALVLIIAHIVTAMLVGKAGREDWKALFSAPFYVFWKLVNLTGILKTAGRGASWKRTSRG
ncbi:MAG: glycosyltransferase family 2 protein [Thiotrichales bacterium]